MKLLWNFTVTQSHFSCYIYTNGTEINYTARKTNTHTHTQSFTHKIVIRSGFCLCGKRPFVYTERSYDSSTNVLRVTIEN